MLLSNESVLPVETRLAASPAKANGDGAISSSLAFDDHALGGCRAPLRLLEFSLDIESRRTRPGSKSASR